VTLVVKNWTVGSAIETRWIDENDTGVSQLCGDTGWSCMAKLTDTEVRWVEYLSRAGVSRKDLAEFYGVSVATVDYIVNHQTWKHLWEAK